MAPLSDPGRQLTRTLLDVVLYTEQFCTGSGFPVNHWIIILSKKEKERYRENEREKKRQRQRHPDIQTYRQRDREREIKDSKRIIKKLKSKKSELGKAFDIAKFRAGLRIQVELTRFHCQDKLDPD